MIPFARSIGRAGRDHGVLVARVRYRLRGWNGRDRSPVADARVALAQLSQRYADLPVALVGHSMGGRVAFAVANAPGVRAVLALAPWVAAQDDVEPLAGREVLVVHGLDDQVTDPDASAAFTARAAAAGVHARYVGVRRSGHTLLWRAPLWHALASGFVLAALGNPDIGLHSRHAGVRAVQCAVHGERRLIV